MPAEEKASSTLSMIEKSARVVALVAIVANGAIGAATLALPSEQRIYGILTFAVVLLATLYCAVLVAKPVYTKDHNQPNLERRVEVLKNKLVERRFFPQLIIAISRGGLGVAGSLARSLGNKEVVPVISLCPTKRSNFDNSFNCIQFRKEDFDSPRPICILIVDDICASGTTLDAAKEYVLKSVSVEDFIVETAAISVYELHHAPALEPSFYVDRPSAPIRDSSGQFEPLPN